MKKLLFVITGFLLVGAGCFQKTPFVPEENDNINNDDGIGQMTEGQNEVNSFINGEAIPVYENGMLISIHSAEYANIYVTSPLPGSNIGNILTIAGNARVFENVVNYRIKDPSGAVIDSGFTTASASDVGQYGPYEVTVDLSTIAPQPLTVEVYWQSAKDGSDADLVSFIVNKQ